MKLSIGSVLLIAGCTTTREVSDFEVATNNLNVLLNEKTVKGKQDSLASVVKVLNEAGSAISSYSLSGI